MDVYFEPRFVWEIKCADISVSPVYKCAYNFLALKEGWGLSLWFPWFIRLRDDKTPHTSTTPFFIYELYWNQAVVAGQDDDEDYY